MAPSFSTLNLQKTTLAILSEKTAAFMKKLQAVADEGSSVDMKELNVSLIFEVLAESLFDLTLDDDLDGFDCEAFLEAQNSTLREAMRRANNPVRGLMFWSEEMKHAEKSRGVLKDLGATVLRKYREKREDAEGHEKASIIEHLIAHDYPTEEHRVSDLMVFLIAGHETTAHSLSFFLYCIATSSEVVREKLLKELKSCIPLLGSSPAPADVQAVTPSSIATLEYFSWCLKEAQRLYPVAPVVGRQLQREINHNGFVVPEKSIVAVHLYGAGRQR